MPRSRALTRNIAGISTEALKNVFVVTMALIFAIEVAGHFLGLFGTGLEGTVNFVAVLVLTEVPLWFAQILLWSRGEDIFEQYEEKLVVAIQTLDKLGFTVEVIEPVITAMREELANVTPTEREKMRAVAVATTKYYLTRVRMRIAEMGSGDKKAP